MSILSVLSIRFPSLRFQQPSHELELEVNTDKDNSPKAATHPTRSSSPSEGLIESDQPELEVDTSNTDGDNNPEGQP